ncbi:uncharacterized protein ACB057_011223 [Neosynchiropus ocellatus]
MELPLMILACLLAGFSDVEADDQTLTRTEGENITITCSHSIAHGNTKYFCRGECTYSDVLITSKGPNTAKYRITDRGNNFDVTIYNLMVKDSGSYWCGIERVGPDTYARVDLTVAPKPREEKKEPEEEKNSSANMKDETVAKRNTTVDEDTKTAGVKNKTEERNVTVDDSETVDVTDMPIEMEEPRPSSETVVYIGAGLGICFGVLVLVLLLFCLQRRRYLGASSADPDGKPDRRSISSPDQAAVLYSLVTADRGPADDPLYCNMPSTQPTSIREPPSEGVSYSTMQ